MIKLLSYLGFIGSWYVSFLLASTLATTKTDYVVAFIFTSVMQYASFYFFKIRQQNNNYFKVACVLFAISILGTMCYQLSVHNEAQNERIKNSDEYLNHKKNVKNQEDLIKEIKDSEVKLNESYDKEIENLVAQRNAMPSDYITRKAQKDIEIKALEKELSEKLEELNNSLITEQKVLRELNNISITTSNLKDTKGYLGISSIISKFFGINKDLVVLAIQFIIAMAFEITAIMLHISASDVIEGKLDEVAPKIKIAAASKNEIAAASKISLVKKKRIFSLKKFFLNLKKSMSKLKSKVLQSAT